MRVPVSDIKRAELGGTALPVPASHNNDKRKMNSHNREALNTKHISTKHKYRTT